MLSEKRTKTAAYTRVDIEIVQFFNEKKCFIMQLKCWSTYADVVVGLGES